MAESSYMVAPGESSSDLSMKRKIALALMQQGTDTSPVQHWTQGLARMFQGGLGGYEAYSAEKSDKEETAKGNALLAQILGGGATPGPVSSSASPMGQDVASVMPSASDASLPRGYRNMNPGNIEDGPFAQSQPGYAGTDGQFAKFASMDNGIGAMDALLSSYEKRGINTPAAIINRWAPASDGNNVSAYAQNVAKQLGIDPTAPVPQEKRQALIAAMAQHENGRPLPGAPQQMAQAQPQGAPSRELLVQMLGNRKTAPLAQSILSAKIQQQFKPSEYDFKERPDGTLVAINKKNPSDMQVVKAPGSGQSAIDYEAAKAAAIATAKGKAEKALSAPERDKQKRQVADIVIEDVDRAIDLIEKSPLTTTGTVGPWLARIGGTPANDVRALVDTVKANAGFAELQKMRDNSPTGGALGQVSEREIAYLQSTIGNLEQSQSAEQFKHNLRRVKSVYEEIVHGGKGGSAPASTGAPKVRKFNPATGKIE